MSEKSFYVRDGGNPDGWRCLLMHCQVQNVHMENEKKDEQVKTTFGGRRILGGISWAVYQGVHASLQPLRQSDWLHLANRCSFPRLRAPGCDALLPPELIWFMVPHSDSWWFCTTHIRTSFCSWESLQLHSSRLYPLSQNCQSAAGHKTIW